MYINVYNQGKAEYQCSQRELYDFEEVDKIFLWKKCPRCGLIPLIHESNNERKTLCGCRFVTIEAESIIDVKNRTGNIEEYDPDELLNNWNNYCLTGEID